MRLRTSMLVVAVSATVIACGTSGAARMGASPAAAPVEAPDRLLPPDASARRWIDSTLASLDVKGKAGQMVMAWFSGRYLPVDSDGYGVAERWIRDSGVGGVIVSIGHPLALADRLNRFQRMAEVPLLVGTDMEHGPGQRLVGGALLPSGAPLGAGTEFPPVMAIGAAGDPELAYELGRVTALEGRAVGIHLDFAPVVDVNNNPANPIINTRSYGEDPEAVARLAAAQIRGLQEHGMLATAKHFPGHGDVSGDSHLTPLILRIDAARADAVELVPFRAAIAEDVAAVMSAHIAFPALAGGDSTLPATLSPRLLDSLLVRELGFDGLVITDALNMGAIVEAFGQDEAVLLAIEAGADILLQPTDPAGAVDAIAAAVAAGRIAEGRLDRSVRKILEAKARVGLHRRRTVDPAAVALRVGGRAHAAVARRVAERGITLVRDRDGLVPLAIGDGQRVLSVTYSDDGAPFAARAFNAALAADVDLERILIQPDPSAAVLDSVAARAAASDVVLLVSDVRVRAGKGSVSIEEPVAALFRAIGATRPTILLSFGSPYVLQQVPDAGTYLLAWGSEEVSQTAAARALAGRTPISGRLPISIPPLHDAGTGLMRGALDPASFAARGAGAPLDPAGLAAIDSAIVQAIENGVTPGAALAVGRTGGTIRLRGFGSLDWAAGSAPVTDSTIYDLASLTKVVGTTTAVMLLTERGRMSLDEPLSRYLPAWPAGGWHDEVTIRRLLRHRSGLPPFVRFWHPSAGALRGLDAVVDAIARLEPAYALGERTVYSDLGFILLGAAVESVAGQSLDALLRAEVWEPLGMTETGFLPLEHGIPLERIAPTEVDTIFRHVHVRGVVHDENAYAIGGVAGHAGLFSSARDLSRFARMLMGGGRLGEVRVLRPETVARFTAREALADRALGWDLASPEGISAAFGAAAFGHTGFTGTSLWMDPELDVFVVLLTNRVNPTRGGSGIGDLRRAAHALAARAAGATELDGRGNGDGEDQGRRLRRIR